MNILKAWNSLILLYIFLNAYIFAHYLSEQDHFSLAPSYWHVFVDLVIYLYSYTEKVLVTQSNSSWPHGLKAPKLLCPRNFPGKNSGVGSHFLLQGIFLIQVSWIAGGFFTIWATWSPCSYTERPILTTLTHGKRPWCWERLKAGGKGDDSGSGGWMVSPTEWTWVWANSGSWWWTGRPGMLQSMGTLRESGLSDWTEMN